MSRFAPHIVSTDDSQFARSTWEGIREQVRPESNNRGLAMLVDYMDHKTLGYDTFGKLRLAFSTVGFK